MAEVTKRQLAEQIGCTKQTITKAMQGLELGGHVVRRGQTDYFDEYAAKAVVREVFERTAARLRAEPHERFATARAHCLGRRSPPRTAGG